MPEKKHLFFRIPVLAGMALFALSCPNPSSPPANSPEVISVKISPETVSVERGKTRQFTVEVTVSGGAAQTVTWSVQEPHAADTVIEPNAQGALLTVAADETADRVLSVRAASTVAGFTGIYGESAVTVVNPVTAPLSPPANVTLSEAGAAAWAAPEEGEENVAGYSVQLYKGADTAGSAETVNKGAPYSVNFLSAMRGGGAGSYTVKVKALGDGENYGDSVEAASAAREVSQKTAVQHVWWFETSKARWVNVDGDSNYAVQLYKDGTAAGDPVPVTRQNTVNPDNPAETVTTYDLTAAITANGPGSYTFGVVTKGNGFLILDGDEKKIDAPYGNSPGVNITLTAADESGELTVSGGTASIGKTGATTSLTLTVAGTGFTGFTWIVDGNPISASGNGITLSGDNKTLTINAADPAIKLGGHSVTVYAMKGSAPWSPASPISFTVTK